MHCLIYRFRVKPEHEERVIRAWSEVTQGCPTASAVGAFYVIDSQPPARRHSIP